MELKLKQQPAVECEASDWTVKNNFLSALTKHDGKSIRTFSLLEHLLDDSSMVEELQKHAEGTELHTLDRLYNWTCEWVYGMRTDQQALEATFSRSHTYTHKHTHIHTHTCPGTIPSVSLAVARRLQVRS